MELSEYYKLVNKALTGDKEAQKKWGECQVEMISKHKEFHSKKAPKKEKEAKAPKKEKVKKEAKASE